MLKQILFAVTLAAAVAAAIPSALFRLPAGEKQKKKNSSGR